MTRKKDKLAFELGILIFTIVVIRFFGNQCKSPDNHADFCTSEE